MRELEWNADSEWDFLACPLIAGGCEPQPQSREEGLLSDCRLLENLCPDAGVNALPHARRGEKERGTNSFDLRLQFEQAFGERDRGAAQNRQNLHYHSLCDMRRRQERDRDIVR